MTSRQAPVILVLAGINGAGKSSVMGSFLRQRRLPYFNPDEAARRIGEVLGCSMEEANARAWEEGRRRLEQAIATRTSHAFESTLGGNTIPALLRIAAERGFDVLVWFVGLATPEQHIARVRARVAAGGHDIPETKIRERWNTSRRNILNLLPFVSELRLFDNSEEGDPAAGTIPPPRLVLHWKDGVIIAPALEVLAETPEWAKAIVAQALKLRSQ